MHAAQTLSHSQSTVPSAKRDRKSVPMPHKAPAKQSRKASPAVPVIDFEIQNHGSIFLLCPLTDSARAWVEEHLPEDVLTFGRGICIEPRYIADIVAGIQRDGLVCA
jgi:hypothetical protein